MTDETAKIVQQTGIGIESNVEHSAPEAAGTTGAVAP